MKISIDFDGTCWSHMAFFRAFMWAMKNAGHEVGMLTGHNEGMKQADLELLESRGFPMPSFWFGRGEGDSPCTATFKSQVILREGIDIHFEDGDFGNPESFRRFDEHLGDQCGVPGKQLYLWKNTWVMRVVGRHPPHVHYE